MPMTELEMLRAHLEEVESEIEELTELAKAIREQIGVMAADASGNTNWGPADAFGARAYLPFAEILEEFANSASRAERNFANMHKNNILRDVYIVSLTEEGDEAMMEAYSDVQNNLFGAAIMGKTFMLGRLSEWPEGTRMPWWVNHPPHQARERFEQMYPSNLDELRAKLRKEAASYTRGKDFYYTMARWGGRGDEWLADHPGFEPA